MQLKYIEDYYDKIKERFPDLEDWEIEKILKHGMRSFFTINNMGADVIIESPKNSFVMYFGKLFRNKKLSAYYYNLKYRIKYRIKYLHNKPTWDGNYYFGLTEEEYQKYIPKKKGRFKNKINFAELTCYKLLEEVLLYNKYKYFFTLSNQEDGKFILKYNDYETRNIKMIAKRDNMGKIQYINEQKRKC